MLLSLALVFGFKAFSGTNAEALALALKVKSLALKVKSLVLSLAFRIKSLLTTLIDPCSSCNMLEMSLTSFVNHDAIR